MEYLTTHDLVWINEVVTGRIQPYNYVTLEAVMAGQYAYGKSDDALTQAATLLERLLTKTPFLEGNRRTALIATLTFLNANGYAVEAGDAQIAPLIEAAAEGRVAALQAVSDIARPAEANLPKGVTLRKLITHECNLHTNALSLLTANDGAVIMKR